MSVPVVDAAGARALDDAAIAAGIPSRALMRAAAFNAATVIMRELRGEVERGVIVYTGPGNNGGDGWALASALDASGVRVRVCAALESRTPDAIAEAHAAAHLRGADDAFGAGVVVDALLGTGAAGEPHGAIAAAVEAVVARRELGASVVALDVPTSPRIAATLTVSFGSVKQSTLLDRSACGEIVVVDTGLGRTDAGATLVDGRAIAESIPPIPTDANKGTRKHVAIVAGSRGMGGAAIIAARGALRSGAGLVKVVTAPDNVLAVQASVPEALVATSDDAEHAIVGWADAVAIGPGLGQSDDGRALVENVGPAWDGPVVIDADALNAFAGDAAAIERVFRSKVIVLTPHPGELARLASSDIPAVQARRFSLRDLLPLSRATLLLKGTPTVVHDTAGACADLVVARGSAVLATGGSGDALSGIIATLLAHGMSAPLAAAAGAWVHGVAAERVGAVRGSSLDDVVDALRDAWPRDVEPLDYPVIARLPRVAA